MQNGGMVEVDKCESTARKKEESGPPQVGAREGLEGGVGVLGSPFGAILSNSPFGARRRLTLDGEDGCGGSGVRLISIAQLSEPPRSPSKVKTSVERELGVEGVGKEGEGGSAEGGGRVGRFGKNSDDGARSVLREPCVNVLGGGRTRERLVVFGDGGGTVSEREFGARESWREGLREGLKEMGGGAGGGGGGVGCSVRVGSRGRVRCLICVILVTQSQR